MRHSQAHVLQTLAWPGVLALATVSGSLAAACLMPFAALSVMVAVTLPAGRATATLMAIWLVNQILGFSLLGYARDVQAVASGLALGIASLAALCVATAARARHGSLSRLLGAFMAAFATYELVLFAIAQWLGGTETFAPQVVAQIAFAETAWFAGLLLLSQGLQKLAPGLAPHAPAFRPA